jgi:NAD(P)-dependent dehydrogenase (short-subunit alcohol dehydrogenase family)
MRELENKTALVTGASRGIGHATAAALAKAGAHVLVHYGRSRQEAESLVVEIRRKGGDADAISADLGTPEGAALLAKQVHSIVGDRLDVLVLLAGVSKSTRIADYTVAAINCTAQGYRPSGGDGIKLQSSAQNYFDREIHSVQHAGRVQKGVGNLIEGISGVPPLTSLAKVSDAVAVRLKDHPASDCNSPWAR